MLRDKEYFKWGEGFNISNSFTSKSRIKTKHSELWNSMPSYIPQASMGHDQETVFGTSPSHPLGHCPQINDLLLLCQWNRRLFIFLGQTWIFRINMLRAPQNLVCTSGEMYCRRCPALRYLSHINIVQRGKWKVITSFFLQFIAHKNRLI